MTDSDNVELNTTMIDLVAAEIKNSGGPILLDMFEKRGAPPPEILFDPVEQELRDSRLTILFNYWSRMRTETGLQHIDSVDPIDFVQALPIVMLLEVLDDGMDFRYLIYGDEISERFGRNMVGHRTSEIPIPLNVMALFMGGYRAVMNYRKPVLTEHAPPPSISVTTWRRLLLPLGDDEGVVRRILVGNIPGVWRKPISQQQAMR